MSGLGPGEIATWKRNRSSWDPGFDSCRGKLKDYSYSQIPTKYYTLKNAQRLWCEPDQIPRVFLDQSKDWMSFFAKTLFLCYAVLQKSSDARPRPWRPDDVLNCSCIGMIGDVELVSIDFKTFPIWIPAVIKITFYRSGHVTYRNIGNFGRIHETRNTIKVN